MKGDMEKNLRKVRRIKDVRFLPFCISLCLPHLDDVFRSDEAVPRGEVPVDVVVALEVGHAAAHLHHDVQQRVHVRQQARLQPTQVLQKAPVL